MNISHDELSKLFEIWATNANDAPSEFDDEFGDVTEYGESCAKYLFKLYIETYRT